MLQTSIGCTFYHNKDILLAPVHLKKLFSKKEILIKDARDGLHIYLTSLTDEVITNVLNQYETLTITIDSDEDYFTQNITIMCQFHNGIVTILNSDDYNSCDIQRYLRSSTLTKCYPGFKTTEALKYLLSVGYHVTITKKH